jgi:hypothetical protein
VCARIEPGAISEGRFVIVGSLAGAPRHPAWFLNLEKTPSARRQPLGGFWVKKRLSHADREIPHCAAFPLADGVEHRTDHRMVVNSMITAPDQSDTLQVGEAVEIRGFAWDGGYGIRSVNISADCGRTWREAELGQDFGRFAFRGFQFPSRSRAPAPIRSRRKSADVVTVWALPSFIRHALARAR